MSQNYLDLLVTQNTDNLQLEMVRKSLKEYSFADLKYFLKAKQWKEANDQTYRLMLYIAKREKEGYLNYKNINSFSCPNLQRIDQLWVNNSENRFGFSVQKEIWIKTGNRLGIKPGQLNNKNYDNYLQFAKAVQWYNNRVNSDGNRGDEYERLMEGIKKDPTVYHGSLPLLGRLGGYKELIIVESYLFSRVWFCDVTDDILDRRRGSVRECTGYSFSHVAICEL